MLSKIAGVYWRTQLNWRALLELCQRNPDTLIRDRRNATHYSTQLQESEHPHKLENSQNIIELWPPRNTKNDPTFSRTTIDLVNTQSLRAGSSFKSKTKSWIKFNSCCFVWQGVLTLIELYALTQCYMHITLFLCILKCKLLMHTLDFFISNLGFCLELGLLNSETEIGTGVA